jgi:hypothetical protein
MAKYKVDIYFEEIYVKTVFVEANDVYDAVDELTEQHSDSINYDIEPLDSEV